MKTNMYVQSGMFILKCPPSAVLHLPCTVSDFLCWKTRHIYSAWPLPCFHSNGKCWPACHRIRWFLRKRSEFLGLCTIPTFSEAPEILLICVLPVLPFSLNPSLLGFLLEFYMPFLLSTSCLFWAETMNLLLHYQAHLSLPTPGGLERSPTKNRWWLLKRLIHIPRIFFLKQKENRWTENITVFRSFILIGTLNIIGTYYYFHYYYFLVIVSPSDSVNLVPITK